MVGGVDRYVKSLGFSETDVERMKGTLRGEVEWVKK